MNSFTLTTNQTANFANAPTLDDRLQGAVMGVEMGRIKKPFYQIAGAVPGALIGGTAGAVLADMQNFDAPNLLGMHGPSLIAPAATAAGALGAEAGSRIAGRLAVASEGIKGFVKGRSGLEAPIIRRREDLINGARAANQAPVKAETVLDIPGLEDSSTNQMVGDWNKAVDSVPDLDTDALGAVAMDLDGNDAETILTKAKGLGSKVTQLLKDSPGKVALAGAGLGAAGLAGGAIMANRDRQVAANMSRYMDAPVASYKNGVYSQARFAASPRVVSSIIGAGLGSPAGGQLGGALGTVGGVLKGATYNPDIIDEETGEKKKIGLLGRAALVTGGGAVGGLAGGLAGNVAGGIVGGTLGAAFPKWAKNVWDRSSTYANNVIPDVNNARQLKPLPKYDDLLGDIWTD